MKEDRVSSVVLLFFGWLALVILFAFFVYKLVRPAGVDVVLGPRGFFRSFFFYDGDWFIAIAKYGYSGLTAGLKLDPSTNIYIGTAFFPLYPALIRIFSYPFFGNYEAAALFVNWAATLGFLIYLFKLVKLESHDSGHDAFRTCLFVLLFPTAIFLALGYSEAVFLLAATASFYHARRSSWIWAGIWGALACLSRIVGLVVLAAVVLEALRQSGWKLSRLRPRMAALALIPLGFVAYLAFLQIRFDNMLVFLKAQKEGWDRSFNLAALYEAPKRLFTAGINSPDFVEALYLVAFLVLFVVLTVMVFRWYGLPMGILALGFLAAAVLTSPASHPLLSANRLVLVSFPAFMVLGRWGRNRTFERVYLVMGTMGLALFTVLFIKGFWAG